MNIVTIAADLRGNKRNIRHVIEALTATHPGQQARTTNAEMKKATRLGGFFCRVLLQHLAMSGGP